MVWAAGVKAPPFLHEIGGLETTRNNQLVVTPTLQTTRDPDIFAMGDCAYLVEKGSIAVDGVSLTVARVTDQEFAVALIPTTLRATTLGRNQPGDSVNLEVDVLAKYVEKLTAGLVPAATGAEQGR